MFFYFFKHHHSREKQNKTNQDPRLQSCIRSLVRAQSPLIMWCQFSPYTGAPWGFGYLMLPAVHVLLAFSSGKYFTQCKCWTICSGLGVLFGACVAASIRMSFHTQSTAIILNLDENNKIFPCNTLKRKKCQETARSCIPSVCL